jgi:hypothetical protein
MGHPPENLRWQAPYQYERALSVKKDCISTLLRFCISSGTYWGMLEHTTWLIHRVHRRPDLMLKEIYPRQATRWRADMRD